MIAVVGGAFLVVMGVAFLAGGRTIHGNLPVKNGTGKPKYLYRGVSIARIWILAVVCLMVGVGFLVYGIVLLAR